VSSTNSAYNLTVANSAASNYALKVMTIVAVIFTPLVLAYQSWSYYVFRARVRGPAAPSGAPAVVTAAPGDGSRA
jgi:cytochrome d ubiquinol oxidase subunit II